MVLPTYALSHLLGSVERGGSLAPDEFAARAGTAPARVRAAQAPQTIWRMDFDHFSADCTSGDLAAEKSRGECCFTSCWGCFAMSLYILHTTIMMGDSDGLRNHFTSSEFV